MPLLSQCPALQMKKMGGFPTDGVLVNGDSGNDIELFVVKGVKGCIVSNAHSELRQWHARNSSESVFLVSDWRIAAGRHCTVAASVVGAGLH